MTAVTLNGKGGPEVLVAANVPTPMPGPGQVLIKVAAAGVNRPDVQQRMGAYPPPAGHSPYPGLEVAGQVAAIGDGVTRWKVGDPLISLVNGGGYAQFCLAEDAVALPVPVGLTMMQAAAVPETFFTVWNNVFERGALQAGEWFMVHGGTSGIGTTAIQLAKAFGARVIATAGSDDKCQACLDLGADRAVNYKTEDFVAISKEVTDGKGIDVTLDMVGGEYTDRNIVAAAEDGRIVQIATLGGMDVQLQHRAPDDEATDAHRFDVAPAHARGQSRLCARDRNESLATDRRRQGEGRDGLDLRARARRRCPPPHGIERSTSARSC